MEKGTRSKEYVGALLTDLSKAFNCLNHELLIAKLEAYGFENNALNWRVTKAGVPQGSILGRLQFNIFLNDIFLFVDHAKITNYADDNISYAIESSVKELLEVLKNETETLLKWFHWNEMKSNNDKCHLCTIPIGTKEVTGCTLVKLLWVIDNKLNFEEQVTKFCKKYLCTDKLRILMKTFVESQFNYCPLVWSFTAGH